MSRVSRLAFVGIAVPDISGARGFYETVLGLDVTLDRPEGLYLKGWEEFSHHSLRIGRGEGPGLVDVGWCARDADALAAIETQSHAFGCTTYRLAENERPGLLGSGLCVDLPSGHAMVFYTGMEVIGRGDNPDLSAQSPARGIGATRIDHLVITAEDPPAAVRYFVDVLELKISDVVVDSRGQPTTCFMFAGNKMHDIAVVRGPDRKYHHVAFAIDDWAAIMRAAQVIATSGYSLEVPPSQHTIGRQATIYFRDPFGNRLEAAAGATLAFEDDPPVTWSHKEMARAIFAFGGPYNARAFAQPI